MKVILTERVPALGNVGEVVNVSQGHARNYLIPHNLAVFADESNRKQLENQKKMLGRKIQEQKNAALEVKNKLDGVVIELVKKVGSTGRLFGTVTTSELAKELESKGIEVERRLLYVNSPIKNVGTFEVRAKLFHEVEAKFSVKVMMDAEQAEELKARSKAASKKTKKVEEVAAETSEDAAHSEEDRLAKEANQILRN